MKFLRNLADSSKIEDQVFKVVDLANNDSNSSKINATIGTLFGEDNKLVALESVYNNYNSISNIDKAKYAASFVGNKRYNEAVDNWIFSEINFKLNHKVFATIGGSGAVSTSFLNTLNAGDTVIIPKIAWGSYQIMAKQYGLKIKTYNNLCNDKFDISSFKETLIEVSLNQKNILVVINDPCQNPTGYSMTINEWKEVVNIINEISIKNNVTILNDIAYIDFSYNKNMRLYLEAFNNISDNVAVLIAFSTSKSLTSYGLRCGALVIACKQMTDLTNIYQVFEKTARGIWSNVPNAAMNNFAEIAENHLEDYNKEVDYYIGLLKKRSEIFIKDALAVHLDLYKYKEGFFITLKMKNNDYRDKLHQKLIENHIYTVKTNFGIRIAICSLPIKDIKGLAFKIKKIQESL